MKGLVRGAAIVVTILGIAGLVFGIILLVAANITHSETVSGLQAKGYPTSIGELRADRDALQAELGVTIFPGTAAWDITSAKVLGEGIALSNLGRAATFIYAGIGILVLGVGLMGAGVVQYKLAGRMT